MMRSRPALTFFLLTQIESAIPCATFNPDFSEEQITLTKF
jgi:hypothetical protein